MPQGLPQDDRILHLLHSMFPILSRVDIIFLHKFTDYNQSPKCKQNTDATGHPNYQGLVEFSMQHLTLPHHHAIGVLRLFTVLFITSLLHYIFY